MSICNPLLQKSQLNQTPAVTVMVVNLFYLQPNLIRQPGFGYLIPRAVPYEQNPELALGVIFDSYASSGQDTAGGTKLTVMLGGHWWKGWDSFPSDKEGKTMAAAVVERHLGIRERPHAVKVTLQRDCIPQYTVGHQDRMLAAHRSLLDAYSGRVRVAGSWFTGVAVPDCALAGYDVVEKLKQGVVLSGLERALLGGEMYIPVNVRNLADFTPYA